MTTHPLTVPLFNRAMLGALTTLLETATQAVEAAQFCANLPTKQSHAAYVDLWHAIYRAPARVASARMLLAQPTPRSPQSAESAAAAIDLRRAGWEVRWIETGRIAHMKLWLFERRTVIIGSHNLTQAAMMMNVEASLLTRDEAVADDVASWYGKLWADAAPRPTIGLG